MDLYAYTQISRLKPLLEERHIDIPRLRGLRLMSEEERVMFEDNEQERVFNSFVGNPEVLMVHARIGGGNWLPYGGAEIEKQPWFIKKVDDGYDSTYCDIYVSLNCTPTECERRKTVRRKEEFDMMIAFRMLLLAIMAISGIGCIAEKDEKKPNLILTLGASGVLFLLSIVLDLFAK